MALPARITLFGTYTSPFVRRIRILASALGIGIDLVDTSTDAGQKQLMAVSPVWKVPAAVIDGTPLFDSGEIHLALVRLAGHDPFARPDDESFGAADWRVPARIGQLQCAVDEALLSLIRLFYLKRDGADVTVPYLIKERARADAVLKWVASELHGPSFSTTPAIFGWLEISLVTALDWMQMRAMYDVAQLAPFKTFLKAHADHALLQSTAPPRL